MPGLGATQLELQCKLRQMAVCARFTGHVKTSCCLFGVCGPLKYFREVCSMSWGRLLLWKNHWKWLQHSVQVWWGRYSGSHQGKGNSISQINRKLRFGASCTCQLVGRELNKGTMVTNQQFCVQKELPLSLSLCPSP